MPWRWAATRAPASPSACWARSPTACCATPASRCCCCRAPPATAGSNGRRTSSIMQALLTDDDLYLFNEGRHYRLYGVLGGQLDAGGADFAVWAPNAEEVSVIGQFNGWDPACHRLQPRASSGIWTGRVPGARRGQQYKYRIRSRVDGYVADKTDPVGFFHDQPPGNASVLWDLDHAWGD